MNKSIISRIIGAVVSMASAFNRNVTGPNITAGPVHVRPVQTRGRRPFKTGIKGVANTNNTRSGAELKSYFGRRNNTRNEFGVMVKA